MEEETSGQGEKVVQEEIALEKNNCHFHLFQVETTEKKNKDTSNQ